MGWVGTFTAPNRKQSTCLLIDPDKLKVPEDSSFVVNESIMELVKQ